MSIEEAVLIDVINDVIRKLNYIKNLSPVQNNLRREDYDDIEEYSIKKKSIESVNYANLNISFIAYAQISSDNIDCDYTSFLLCPRGIDTPSPSMKFDDTMEKCAFVNYYTPVSKLFASAIGTKINGMSADIIHQFDEIRNIKDKYDTINNCIKSVSKEMFFYSAIDFITDNTTIKKETEKYFNNKSKRDEFYLSGQNILDMKQDEIMRSKEKNIILYGPPGTGKTTTAIKVIIKHCFYDNDGNRRKEILPWKLYSISNTLGNYIEHAFTSEGIDIQNIRTNINCWENEKEKFYNNLLNLNTHITYDNNQSSINITKEYEKINKNFIEFIKQYLSNLLEELKNDNNNFNKQKQDKLENLLTVTEYLIVNNIEIKNYDEIIETKNKFISILKESSNKEKEIRKIQNEHFFIYKNFLDIFKKFLNKFNEIKSWEIDIFLYIIISIAVKEINNNNDDKIQIIRDKMVEKIIIDEASNFSAIQLKTIKLLSRNGIVIIGDLRQKITDYGITSWDECYNANDKNEYKIFSLDLIYRQNPKLTAISKKMITNDEISKYKSAYPNTQDYPKPEKFIINKEGDIAKSIDWISESISQIYEKEQRLPTIALFVNSNEEIDRLYNSLSYKLKDNNIEIEPCYDGKTTEGQKVRIFNYQYISGLEFEVCFLINIGNIQSGYKDKYIYLGITRTVKYLKLICNNDDEIPESIRDSFLSVNK